MDAFPRKGELVVRPFDAPAQDRGRGRVIDIGPGTLLAKGTRASMHVRKGATVVYGKYAGTEIELKGEKHLILQESELLGIVEEDSRPTDGAEHQSENEGGCEKPLEAIGDALSRPRSSPRGTDVTSMGSTAPSLARERAAFERDLPELLACGADRFAVYMDSRRIGLYSSYSDALAAGYDASRFERPFLVRQVEATSSEGSTWELGRSID